MDFVSDSLQIIKFTKNLLMRDTIIFGGIIMKSTDTKDFIAYEYLSLFVESDKEPLYIDCYENFGWTLIRNASLVDKEDYYINSLNDKRKLNIKFKRDRKIKNKNELLRLQRKMESTIKEIERLEHYPDYIGMIYSIMVGLVGTVFMALSVFSLTATTPHYLGCILFGLMGCIGFFLPYFLYKKIKENKEQENLPLIEEQYNLLYDFCCQAKKLID